MLGRTFGLAFLSSVEDFLRKLTYDNMSPQQLIATPVRSNAPDRAKPWGAHPADSVPGFSVLHAARSEDDRVHHFAVHFLHVLLVCEKSLPSP